MMDVRGRPVAGGVVRFDHGQRAVGVPSAHARPRSLHAHRVRLFAAASDKCRRHQTAQSLRNRDMEAGRTNTDTFELNQAHPPLGSRSIALTAFA